MDQGPERGKEMMNEKLTWGLGVGSVCVCVHITCKCARGVVVLLNKRRDAFFPKTLKMRERCVQRR